MKKPKLKMLLVKRRTCRMQIAFDSHVGIYFVDANRDRYDPRGISDASLAVQRLATFRLFLYCEPVILPTVGKEIGDIPDEARRREHVRWTHYHWHEVLSCALIRLTSRPMSRGERHNHTAHSDAVAASGVIKRRSNSTIRSVLRGTDQCGGG